ncbi:MAG: hypothetical protein IJV07_05825 [Alphaproteobacteria bacterium]|nr:hypothetical protein [Alphaproteobacteria bacterium]
MKLAEQLSDYDELVYVLKVSDTPDKLRSLNTKKLRLALPPILRPEKPWQNLIQTLWQAGFTRWEIGNPAGLTLLPQSTDISLDNTVSLMNTQAIEEAFSQGISRFAFSTEDTRDNIQALTRQTGQGILVLYQDPALFLSANCIRENGCSSCSKGRLEMNLTDGKGKYLLISENCLTTVINSRPFALPPTAQDIPVSGYRVDFCHRHYTIQQAKEIISKIKNRQKISGSTDGNFEKQFAS